MFPAENELSKDGTRLDSLAWYNGLALEWLNSFPPQSRRTSIPPAAVSPVLVPAQSLPSQALLAGDGTEEGC